LLITKIAVSGRPLSCLCSQHPVAGILEIDNQAVGLAGKWPENAPGRLNRFPKAYAANRQNQNRSDRSVKAFVQKTCGDQGANLSGLKALDDIAPGAGQECDGGELVVTECNHGKRENKDDPPGAWHMRLVGVSVN